MDWTAGYVADIGYSSEYYAELNPVRMTLALLNAGYLPPKIRYACELGFGQGVSVNIHAAAGGDVKWFGTDLLPSHAAFAQGLAGAAASGAELTDESFEEFFARTDLPDFDFICLHGVWSWVSDQNRALIVDFLRRKLRVGGVVYISYNALPGWAAAMPMRELFATHARYMSPPAADSAAKVEAALKHVDGLFAAKPGYTLANPLILERFEKLKVMDRRYLAHEYFNQDWRPMYFTEVVEALSAAKLSFACSANYGDILDELWMTSDQKGLIESAPNEVLGQLTRDFIVNQQFRRDIWVKGAERLPPARLMELVEDNRVVLTCDVKSIQLSQKVNGRDVSLQESVYAPLLEILGDNRPHRIGDLMSALAPRGVQPLEVFQAVMVLVALNHLAPAQEAAAVDAAAPSADRFNAEVIERARHSHSVSSFASPVTGGGVAIDQMALQLLGAFRAGSSSPAEAAQRVWAALSAEGRVVLRNGKALSTPEENLAELTQKAERLLESELALLDKLGVAVNEIRTNSGRDGQSC